MLEWAYQYRFSGLYLPQTTQFIIKGDNMEIVIDYGEKITIVTPNKTHELKATKDAMGNDWLEEI